MTFAKIILPYNYRKNEDKASSKDKQKLKGKLTSALKKGGTAVKNTFQNPTAALNNLSKYMLESDNVNKISNKFSGIALAQLLANGKVENKEALDYLFLGFASAMDKQYISLGYSSITQMKDAIANGTINVGSFLNGFTNIIKANKDYTDILKAKNEQKAQNVIELDITSNFREQYQSEAPDRRVQDGKSFSEVLHNMPEIFSLECGLQDGKRYSVSEFKEILTHLRDSKMVFSLYIDGEEYSNLVLQNFAPTVQGARSGIDYSLELKKVNIGSIELTPITIQPLRRQISENDAGTAAGNASGGYPPIPDIVTDPFANISKTAKNKNRSMLKNILEPEESL